MTDATKAYFGGQCLETAERSIGVSPRSASMRGGGGISLTARLCLMSVGRSVEHVHLVGVYGRVVRLGNILQKVDSGAPGSTTRLEPCSHCRQVSGYQRWRYQCQ